MEEAPSERKRKAVEALKAGLAASEKVQGDINAAVGAIAAAIGGTDVEVILASKKVRRPEAFAAAAAQVQVRAEQANAAFEDMKAAIEDMKAAIKDMKAASATAQGHLSAFIYAVSGGSTASLAVFDETTPNLAPNNNQDQ